MGGFLIVAVLADVLQRGDIVFNNKVRYLREEVEGVVDQTGTDKAFVTNGKILLGDLIGEVSRYRFSLEKNVEEFKCGI